MHAVSTSPDAWNRAPILLPEDYIFTEEPHFLWITEFPLFTRADKEKNDIAQGRWSSTHHPFTAPMWEDIESMYNGRMKSVRLPLAKRTYRYC
jgi:aspartyl-tRNA synthetase